MLRLARKSDLMDIFYLANDEIVRFYSFNQNQISLEEHKKWFKKNLASKETKIYIYRNCDNDLIGVCRLECVGGGIIKLALAFQANFANKAGLKNSSNGF